MPLHIFNPGVAYEWDTILEELSRYGYRRQKLGALDMAADDGLPIFVFPSEPHEKWHNGHVPGRQHVVMEVNPAREDLNKRLRASENGLQVGLFYRRPGQRSFTFLGPARFVRAEGHFYTFAY